MLKNQQNNRRVSVLFTLTALVVVLVCNTQTGRGQTTQSDTVWSKYIGSEVKGVKFSPDGQFIYAAALGRGPLKLRTETGEILTEFDGMVYNHSQNTYSLDISMDGNFLYAADTGRYIFKYDTKSGIIVDKIETPYSEKKGIFYRALTVSDLYIGVLIIYDAPTWDDPLNRDGVVIVFDKNTKEIVKEIKTKIINRVKFSPNGEYLCLYESAENNQDTRSILLNTKNWEEYATFIHGKVSISDIAFSPDGSLLASCGWDGFIKIWDVKERKLVREFNYGAKITAINFLSNDIVSFCAGEWPIYKCKILNLNNLEIKGDNLINFVKDADYSSLKNYIVMDDGDGVLLLNLKRYLTTIDIDVTKTVAQVIPNPNSNQLKILISILESNIYNIDIYDSNSKLINKIFDGFIEKGEKTLNWDSSNYPSGAYYCIIKSKNYSDTLKIIVQR